MEPSVNDTPTVLLDENLLECIHHNQQQGKNKNNSNSRKFGSTKRREEKRREWRIVFVSFTSAIVLHSNPMFVSEEAKSILGMAIWNDTLFLSSLNVMDYSMLVGVDEENNELIVGVIGMYLFQFILCFFLFLFVCVGLVAQLVARLIRIEKVLGSTPGESTLFWPNFFEGSLKISFVYCMMKEECLGIG